MSQHQSKDPLHGVTLEQLLNKLVDHYGWSELGTRIRINCFRSDPSIKSSLKLCVARPGAQRGGRSVYRYGQPSRPSQR